MGSRVPVARPAALRGGTAKRYGRAAGGCVMLSTRLSAEIYVWPQPQTYSVYLEYGKQELKIERYLIAMLVGTKSPII